MLISMPTGTSAIFGVFQVMRFSQLIGQGLKGATCAPTLKRMTGVPVAQVAG